MYRAILACFILAVMLSGCTRDQATTSDPCQNCSVISFRADVIPIFSANCSISGCHTGPAATAPGRISLDSAIAYAQATHAGTGYVNPGSPNTSVLYSQLLPGFPNHMPNNGTQLSSCDIRKIYCWILQGAQNN